MVKLLSKSPVALNSPTLQQWDNSFRENYEMYQTEIDKNTYALQRSIRGFWIFGKAFYPALTQHYSQKLELYQLKQQLGKIEQSEVNLYKTVDPSISTVLNKTFSTQWPLVESPRHIHYSWATSLRSIVQFWILMAIRILGSPILCQSLL
ncbi:unnamed protein product (macronuclear) [Paramecium tetraurelia]|uniref:Uncharacterized protein n=1 Tax=Paramecium tetraurelia TaxID=5888 RepID=A0BRL6_PARTE|nr:uncharacterized protein GSPATT00031414001 [Paramecium tetraurelia]CAK61183.1 unnamed protein product [Paramecium tetraurelia]|eukprot:XP_001428581.1 hypothetical protein (macronuclear) [Paramecium tetraurelia strain d4-2]